ncbi:hypothetical protein EGW08_002973, partial [Elysia chlorotica]
MDVESEHNEQSLCEDDNQALQETTIAEEGDESDGENQEEEDPGEDHEFEIIDQVETEDEEEKNDPEAQGERNPEDGVLGANNRGTGSNAASSGSSDDDDDDDVDDTEVHAMLEKGINKNSIRKREEPTEGKPVIKLKTVLKELETDPFDILPEGWIFVTHNCGMPVYLHKESRVCTLARPYSLGSASTRTHNIPISAIPCLMYRRQLDRLSSQTENGNHIWVAAGEKQGIVRISSFFFSKMGCFSQFLSLPDLLKMVDFYENYPFDITVACLKKYKAANLCLLSLSTWKERKKHMEQKYKRNRPELVGLDVLCFVSFRIFCLLVLETKRYKIEFVLNPTGKSYLCILHEYMQRTLKIQPLYVFKELENSKTPYGATVTINNIEYGTGYASSKKVAKQEAAKETLKILMPDLFNKISDHEIKHTISDLSFFDNVKVSDSRIFELGIKVGQPSPFEILQECLRRNFGMGNTQCDISTKPLKNQKCEYSITVGKHSATVVARNKRDGKQLAAQAILAILHPHVPSWGSLLRLYGTSVEKPIQK